MTRFTYHGWPEGFGVSMVANLSVSVQGASPADLRMVEDIWTDAIFVSLS
jgi:hypothetical protein